MAQVYHLIILVCVYSCVAITLSLSAGHGGMVSLCHAALFGVGAYVFTVFHVNYFVNTYYAVILAIIITSMSGLLVSFFSQHRSADHLTVATIGVQFLFIEIIKNGGEMTGGPAGLICSAHTRGHSAVAASHIVYIIVSLFCLLGVVFVFRRLAQSPFGRVLRSASEDESLVVSLGKNVQYTKAVTMLFSGAGAGIAGVIYASYIGYIHPSAFDLSLSIMLLAAVILGGMRTATGTLAGATLIILAPELLRYMPISSDTGAAARNAIFALLLMIIIIKRGRRRSQYSTA